jgi:hypothetical protein
MRDRQRENQFRLASSLVFWFCYFVVVVFSLSSSTRAFHAHTRHAWPAWRAQNVWEDVLVVSISEFGRTLTDNGQGTDHAWGGNHFLAGGGIHGGTQREEEGREECVFFGGEKQNEENGQTLLPKISFPESGVPAF